MEQGAGNKIKHCEEIAGRLKRGDRENYGDIFKWIYRARRCGSEWAVILEALQIMERHDGYGQKPGDLYQYMNGIVRPLRQRKEANELRRGATTVATLLDPALRRFEKAGFTTKGTKSTKFED